MKRFKLLNGLSLALFNLFFFNGCIEEKVEVSKPKTESLTMQLHNQNSVGNIILDNTEPDIYYFQQNEDGTYTFTLSFGKYIYNASVVGLLPFSFDWRRKFMIGKLDNNGTILKLDQTFFPIGPNTGYGPMRDYINTFDNLSVYNPINPVRDIPNRYTAENLKITYPAYGDGSRGFLTVNLDGIKEDPGGYGDEAFFFFFDTDIAGLKRTSDGIFLIYGTAVGLITQNVRLYTYARFDVQNNFVYSVTDPSFTAYNFVTEEYSAYVTNKGNDTYFINVSPYEKAEAYPYGVFVNNEDVTFAPTGSPFIDLRPADICFRYYALQANGKLVVGPYGPDFDLEIRFGGDNHQWASLYSDNSFSNITSWKGQVDVPFEVWDATNNVQLKAAFVDRNWNGEFDLKNWDNNAYAEWIIIPDYKGGDFDYQRIYDGSQTFISDFRCGDGSDPINPTCGLCRDVNGTAYIVYPTLKPGINWNPLSIPETTVAIKKYQGDGWKTRLIKVNESGVTEVKRDFLQGVNLRDITKVVPFNKGYALLFNGGKEDFPPAEIILIDENFQQIQSYSIGLANESEYKMVASGNTVYYAAGPKGLRLVAIRDGQKIEKVLDFLGQDKILKEPAYNITATKSGGIAILAWVRPTANTRDLLFMEFDENLNLVKKSN